MRIAHRDFVPEDQTQALDWDRKYEPVESVVERANRWLAENDGIDLLHIETLLLPASLVAHRKGSTQSEGTGWHWFQVIRVWYRR